MQSADSAQFVSVWSKALLHLPLATCCSSPVCLVATNERNSLIALQTCSRLAADLRVTQMQHVICSGSDQDRARACADRADACCRGHHQPASGLLLWCAPSGACAARAFAAALISLRVRSTTVHRLCITCTSCPGPLSFTASRC